MKEVTKEIVSSAKGKQLAVAPSASAVRDAPNGYHWLYPSPLAKYEEVVANPELFKDTLMKLHTTMGTRYMVPTIGGKELDLHQLFMEVTSRGGIDQVIRERRWKEVTYVFNFPPTATNASFVLRKHYYSLMHHYEQIYFFGAREWSSPPTAPSHTSTSIPVPVEKLVEAVGTSETSAAARKRRRDTESAPPPTKLINSPVTSVTKPTNPTVYGVIDGKFEHGYFVTVMVGAEILKGVIYRTLECSSAQTQQNTSVNNNSGVVAIPRRRRRRRKLSKRDPTHPKPSRSGYNFFFAEQHVRLKVIYPNKNQNREISRMIGELWNKLTEDEKSVYQGKGVKDKERYRSEMEKYRERLKLGNGQVLSHVMPIRQIPAEMEGTMMMCSKTETEEGDLPSTLPSESNSTEIYSGDGGKSDKDSELPMDLHTSPESGATGTESAAMVEDHVTEGEGFELRRRQDVGMEDKEEGAGSAPVSDSKEV